MSAKRQAAKRDANEPEIIAALVAAGASVEQLSAKDIPDLLVGFGGVNYLMEVKNPATYGKLSDDQSTWHEAWPGQACVVETVEDALMAIGRMDKPLAVEVAEPITVAAVEPEVISVDVATTEPAEQPDIKLLPAPRPLLPLTWSSNKTIVIDPDKHPLGHIWKQAIKDEDFPPLYIKGYGQRPYEAMGFGWTGNKPTVTLNIGTGKDIYWTVFADRVSIESPFIKKATEDIAA